VRTKNPYSTRGRVSAALTAAEKMLTDGVHFGGFGTYEGPPLPKTEKEVDAFIKARIRLYVETWLIKPLQVAAKKLEPPKPRRINWSHFKLHPRNCPVIEETADGVACGTCTFFMKEEHVCPRHGKIIELDNPPNEPPIKKTD